MNDMTITDYYVHDIAKINKSDNNQLAVQYKTAITAWRKIMLSNGATASALLDLWDSKISSGKSVHMFHKDDVQRVTIRNKQFKELKIHFDKLRTFLNKHPKLQASKAVNTKVSTLLEAIPLSDDILTEVFHIRKNKSNSLIQHYNKVIHTKNQFVEANLQLVLYVVKTMKLEGITFEEAVQEGNIGIIRAVEKFNLEKNCKFSTYAVWWIRQSINRAIDQQNSIIKMPVYLFLDIRTKNKAISHFEKRYQRKPTQKELADCLQTTQDKIQHLCTAEKLSNSMSLDTLATTTEGEKGDSSIVARIPDPNSIDPDEELYQESIKSNTRALLRSLTVREREIILRRFGINQKYSETLEEIGESMGFCRERCRQIEAQALATLKKKANNQYNV